MSNLTTVTVMETIQLTYEIEVNQTTINDYLDGDEDSMQDAILDQGVITYDGDRLIDSNLLDQEVLINGHPE